MEYKSATISYWSGTGNSYRVAHWFGAAAEKSGLKTQIISLDKFNTANSVKRKDNDRYRQNRQRELIIFVFPTHGFTAPWRVLKTIWKSPRGDGADVYCLATRAGLKFGSFFVPGISGSATFLVALLCLLKGYQVHGTMSVDMPSNWFSLHPIQSLESHEAIIDRAERKIDTFREKVLSRSKNWLTANNLYELLWSMILFWLSIAYLFMVRFFLAKLFFANNSCDGCAVCARNCPVGAIVMKGKSRCLPFWSFRCESCMRCAAICPRRAVEAGHSWGVVLYFITAFPISTYLLALFAPELTTTALSTKSLVLKALDLLYFYPAIFVSYTLFLLLMRIPLFCSFFSHTTMTSYTFWGRYREPKTKLKDLS